MKKYNIMKTLTQEQFNIELEDAQQEYTGPDLFGYIPQTIGGEITYHNIQDMGTHEIHFLIILIPAYIITNAMLCQIFDEGNHCISNGSIFYEDDHAYIAWSNKGHI